MATADTDPSKPHHFTASNSASLDNIYQSLGDRVSSYGTECKVTPVEKAAGVATVDVYQGTTRVATAQTDDAGAFTITKDLSGNDIQPGTYTFKASITVTAANDRARTYNILTDGIGGTEIVPELVVGEDAGTYSKQFVLEDQRQTGLRRVTPRRPELGHAPCVNNPFSLAGGSVRLPCQQ